MVFFWGVANYQYTNSKGDAHFSEANGIKTIYVKVKKVLEGQIEGRKIIYLWKQILQQYTNKI